MTVLSRPCKTCGTLFPMNRSQAYCKPACRPRWKAAETANRFHYSDIEARAAEIAACPALSAARAACTDGPRAPSHVLLERIRLEGIRRRKHAAQLARELKQRKKRRENKS
jgi:hypothetical protein